MSALLQLMLALVQLMLARVQLMLARVQLMLARVQLMLARVQLMLARVQLMLARVQLMLASVQWRACRKSRAFPQIGRRSREGLLEHLPRWCGHFICSTPLLGKYLMHERDGDRAFADR